MEGESYDIQIVKRYKISKIGMPLIIIGVVSFIVFIFSTANDIYYNNQDVLLISSVCLLMIIIGVLFNNLKKNENSLIQFLPEGIIMKTNNVYIPIKYAQIKKIPMSEYSLDRTKTYFYLYTEDSRRFEIKIDIEIYDSLLNAFPDKNKS